MSWTWHWWLFFVTFIIFTIISQLTRGAANAANIAKYGPEADWRADPAGAIRASIVFGAFIAAMVTALAGFVQREYMNLLIWLIALMIAGYVIWMIRTMVRFKRWNQAEIQWPPYSDIESYCAAMSEIATPTLMARIEGIPKQQAIKTMQGMTDPKSIRMVQEVIQFAYSRPPGMKIDAMRAELRKLCVERKIFTQ